jgi:UDP-N-acetylmuramoyl-tripeptide--D-alanyl-D-alanine ligase
MTVAELVRGTQGALVRGDLGTRLEGVSIDSRTCAPGSAFVAIRGPYQDGHAFVGHAASRGATALVVSHLTPEVEACGHLAVVLVDDTTRALGRLGAFHRRRFSLPVVGVTGSVGKTTTKELAATVLGTRYRVLKAPGSLNNQWGVPLTLLQLAPTHEVAVVELGMNALGEIAALAELARPSVGVVTTIAPAHLGHLGSLDAIQQAKGELVEAIPADGVVVLNADDARVLDLGRRTRGRVVTFGESPAADLSLSSVVATPRALGFTVTHGGSPVAVTLPLPGRHNAWNAAAALAVGHVLGVSLGAGAEALRQASPVQGRLAWREVAGVLILDDTYNANPVSLRSALDVLTDAGGAEGAGRAWVLLGDMLELGPRSEEAHRDAGRWVAALPVAGLVTVGQGARLAALSAAAAGCPEVRACDTPAEGAHHLAGRLAAGDRVLVKGSRGMHMERALEALLAGLGAGRVAC